MKLLIVGSAGYVGSIASPALEQAHECFHFDLKPIAGVPYERMFVGDVMDGEALRLAVYGKDAVIYMPLGVRPGSVFKDVSHVGANFDVHAEGWFNTLTAARRYAVRQLIYVSSLSVYEGPWSRRTYPLDESEPADCLHAYGLSKRLGESIAQMFVDRSRLLSILSIRLNFPRNEADWPHREQNAPNALWPLGPKDVQRLFLKAVEFATPGHHIIHASGDVHGKDLPNAYARQLIGWEPRGE